MNENFYQKLLDNLFDGVYFTDPDRRIVYWNNASERITGFSRGEVVGSRCSDNILKHIDYRGHELCTDGCPLWATLRDGRARTVDAYLHHKEGHRVPVSIRITPVFDDNGNITGAVEIFSDNTGRESEFKEMETLRSAAYTDPLTGIGNRRFCDMVLKTRMYEYKNHGIKFGVIFLDIDNFKTINDSHGHETGDLILKMVAKTSANILRKLDVICRWGGEEFIAIIPDIDVDYLAALSERIRSFVERSFIVRDGRELFVTVSIGAAIIREDESIDELIDRADRLMYRSKNDGRNRVSCAE